MIKFIKKVARWYFRKCADVYTMCPTGANPIVY